MYSSKDLITAVAKATIKMEQMDWQSHEYEVIWQAIENLKILCSEKGIDGEFTKEEIQKAGPIFFGQGFLTDGNQKKEEKSAFTWFTVSTTDGLREQSYMEVSSRIYRAKARAIAQTKEILAQKGITISAA